MSLEKTINLNNSNIQNYSNTIWNIADILRNYLKPHEYSKVILPLVVIKRFNDCLIDTKKQVLDTYEDVKDLDVRDGFLTQASGFAFYNTSIYDFDKLLEEPASIEKNFNTFLHGFSENVQEIISLFDFEHQLKRINEFGLLYLVLQEFNKPVNFMGADAISAEDFGNIYQDLIRRFAESYNETPGEHFTSVDIVYTCCDLLLSRDLDQFNDDGIITVYDQTCGTGQMLFRMIDRIRELDKNAQIAIRGQELNPETAAMAKAECLVFGYNSNDIQCGNTLSDDRFGKLDFDLAISNPPFGVDYKSSKDAVMAEYAQGDKGRFAPGTPKISDGQMLFDLNGLSKLSDKGRMAIIHNGSPLFNGKAGSGESEIRRYYLENDWLDCIVKLSTDLFMNTGITSYVFIFDKDKPSYRKNKVQLIDASQMCVSRRKNIGSKRVDITDEDREIIVQAYGDFQNKSYELNGKVCESQIKDVEDFGFSTITVEQPQLDKDGRVVMKAKKPVADTSKRDTEKVPLKRDIDEYFDTEIRPYKPDAWIDKKKTKIGYEIPFTRYFYKYEKPEASADIEERIKGRIANIESMLAEIFGERS